MADDERFHHPARRSGQVTEPFFDLSLPDHAYLFGLLQTDGHHSASTRNRGRITIELAATDAEILYWLDMVPWYSSVRYRTRDTNFASGYQTATWALSSWDARSELTELGLPPGPKSRSARPPRGAIARRDYVRGRIDGDGSVGFTGANHPFVSFVTASEHLARFYEAYAAEATGIGRTTNRNQRDGVFNPMHQTDAAAVLARDLYRPGDLAMERKATAASVVAAWIRPPTMRRASIHRRWTTEEDVLVMADRSLDQIAEELGRSYQSVSMRRVRLRGRA